MGLSASQGRMLSLTSRLSDLEYRAQNVSNQKTRLAANSEKISKDYLNALDAKKITAYNPDTDSHIDATLESLYKLNASGSNGTKRVIVDKSGNVVCPTSLRSYMPSNYSNTSTGGVSYATGAGVSASDISTAYTSAQTAKNNNQSAFGSLDNYLDFMFNGNVPTGNGSQSIVQYYTNIYNGLESYAQSFGYTTATPDVISSTNYQGDVNATDGKNPNFISDPTMTTKLITAYNSGGSISPSTFSNASTNSANYSSTQWLYQQLSMGNLFLVEYNQDGGGSGNGAWEKISWSSGDAQLLTKNDDKYTADAEAEYETAMAEVQAKDKRFDLELKTIDTEHNAVQQEIDSVSKVVDKNIERTFKLFS